MFRSITLKDVALAFPNKTCFEEFSTEIHPGSRIAIIGRNGSGKSSLLRILAGQLAPIEGRVILPDDCRIGYVEQVIADFDELSGGQRFNKRFSEALTAMPDLLLLDEPTNHLDKKNRKSLLRKLSYHTGTLIVVSHDVDLLRNAVDTLWYVSQGRVEVFHGGYDDYQRLTQDKKHALQKELGQLRREKKEAHCALMKEQKRAACSRSKGQKSIKERKWPTVTSHAKARRAEQTSGKKKAGIDQKKQQLVERLSELHVPDIIAPTFSLSSDRVDNGTVLSIRSASVGYDKDGPVLENIYLALSGNERLAICGDNGSGKSTLLKAILGKQEVMRTGEWQIPGAGKIGYLDQHYDNLNPQLSVLDQLTQLRPDWSQIEIRRHLSDFLFRSNEEVKQLAESLSGGERARASLSLIAAQTPKLLILDEITNNLDLETREYVVQVLKAYPGAMIVVSHDDDFLQAIEIDQVYDMEDGCCNPA